MQARNVSRSVGWLVPLAWFAALAACGSPAGESSSDGFVFEKTNRVILESGPAGSFDETNAKYPCVLKVGNEWWMWYNGRSADSFTGEIGLATSSDGLSWTKANDGKPIFRHGPPGAPDSTEGPSPEGDGFGRHKHAQSAEADFRSRPDRRLSAAVLRRFRSLRDLLKASPKGEGFHPSPMGTLKSTIPRS